MLIQGELSIGTLESANLLDVEGAVAIGVAYSGTTTAPSDGLIVQGLVGLGVANPHSKLHVGGAMATTTQSFSNSVNLGELQSVLLGNAASGNITATLPDATGILGRRYTVKKVDLSANSVRVAAFGGQTIDGATTYNLAAQWRYVTVVSDGSNWMIISN
jgi:hypothetical protein